MSETYTAEARSVQASRYTPTVTVEWSAEVEAPTLDAATAEALAMFGAKVGIRSQGRTGTRRSKDGRWVTHTQVLAPRRRNTWLMSVKRAGR